MVGKGTWNHTKSHRSAADGSPPLETEVTGQTNPPVTHCISTHTEKAAVKPSESPTAQPPSSHSVRLQDEGGTYRSRGVFPPDETVQDKADTKDDTRIQGSCLQEQSQVKRKRVTHQPNVSL